MSDLPPPSPCEGRRFPPRRRQGRGCVSAGPLGGEICGCRTRCPVDTKLRFVDVVNTTFWLEGCGIDDTKFIVEPQPVNTIAVKIARLAVRIRIDASLNYKEARRIPTSGAQLTTA